MLRMISHRIKEGGKCFISGKNKQPFLSVCACVCVRTANHSGSSRYINDIVGDDDKDGTCRMEIYVGDGFF